MIDFKNLVWVVSVAKPGASARAVFRSKDRAFEFADREREQLGRAWSDWYDSGVRAHFSHTADGRCKASVVLFEVL